MDYRPEIDGLRALAVLPVVLFHAGYGLFQGGYVGVDIFFVISGYLITSILIKDMDRGAFSYLSFVERRVRRIAPALFTLVFLVILFGWVLLDLNQLAQLGSYVIGTITFSSNFVALSENNYFDAASELNPLLHTWSLAVEEQFYLIFPFILLLIWRLKARGRVIALLALFALSFLISEWGWRHEPEINFYFTLSRFWEILTGCLIALWLTRAQPKGNSGLALLGLALIACAIFFFRADTPFPSFYTLAPVLGTALVIVFAQGQTLVGRALSNRVLVQIGLISYSVYLFHQPIFAFARQIGGHNDLGPVWTPILVLLSLVCGYISWLTVERYFKDRTRVSKRALGRLAVGAALVLLTLGIASRMVAHTFETRLAKTLATAEYVYVPNLDGRLFALARIEAEAQLPETLILGSSRAMQIGSEAVGAPILNLAVSGSSIQDYVAIAGQAVAKDAPARMILGIDPWHFNANNGQDRWESVSAQYAFWSAQMRTGGGANQTAPAHTNWAAGIHRVTGWFYNQVNLAQASVPKDGQAELRAKKRQDGLLIYGTKVTTRTQEQIAATFPHHRTYAMKDFRQDPARETELGSLVNWLRAQGVAVTFLLAPLSPGPLCRS